MSSNAPYYQDVQDSDEGDSVRSDAWRDSTMTSQPSAYPDSLQHVDVESTAYLRNLVKAAANITAQDNIEHTASENGPAQYPQARPQSRGQLGAKRKLSNEDIQAAEANDGSIKRRRQAEYASVVDDEAGAQSPVPAANAPNAEFTHVVDARAAGVHSAAALFRAPSDLSKKHTRPPMSKLFSSLELTPENFLKIQAAAKRFMLDPDHPDRQDCVGNRGQSDSGQIRLGLQKCVRTFLEEGNGEEFFARRMTTNDSGECIQEAHSRSFVWPEDEERTVKLCTPLLRRMVTNERQRQYALETRKGAKPGKEAASSPIAAINAQYVTEQETSDEAVKPHADTAPWIRIYFPNKTGREVLRDHVDMPLAGLSRWTSLQDVISRQISALRSQSSDQTVLSRSLQAVEVLTSKGLTNVSNQEDWDQAIGDIMETVWLERNVKVIVSVSTGEDST